MSLPISLSCGELVSFRLKVFYFGSGVSLCATCVQCPRKSIEGIISPGTGVNRQCLQVYRFTNPDLLEEQPVILITSLSFRSVFCRMVRGEAANKTFCLKFLPFSLPLRTAGTSPYCSCLFPFPIRRDESMTSLLDKCPGSYATYGDHLPS